MIRMQKVHSFIDCEIQKSKNYKIASFLTSSMERNR